MSICKAYSIQVDVRATDGWKQVFSLSEALDIQRAQVLSALYASQNNGLFSSREKVVAYQALIWEIVYDYDGTAQSINLRTGSLQIAGIKSNLFASMKNTAMRGGPDANLRVISGDAGDGQILVVPLPSGFGLAGIGLLGLWSTTRRRKKALSASRCAWPTLTHAMHSPASCCFYFRECYHHFITNDTSPIPDNIRSQSFLKKFKYTLDSSTVF